MKKFLIIGWITLVFYLLFYVQSVVSATQIFLHQESSEEEPHEVPGVGDTVNVVVEDPPEEEPPEAPKKPYKD